jgi:hypothetical protein
MAMSFRISFDEGLSGAGVAAAPGAGGADPPHRLQAMTPLPPQVGQSSAPRPLQREQARVTLRVV